jgi:hypothetical protein
MPLTAHLLLLKVLRIVLQPKPTNSLMLTSL